MPGEPRGQLARNQLVIAEEHSGFMRWLPMVVVLGTMAGFVALAWYAYHAGAESVKEEDLLVVEADKTPIKEKPVNPGGMQFPNQDKTIFETFSGNPPPPPKVERVLPAPEEPTPANLDTSETGTWINDKLHKPAEEAKPAAPAKTEQVIAPPPKPVEETKPAPKKNNQTETYVAQQALDHAVAAAPSAPAPEVVKPEPKPASVKVEPVKPEPKKIDVAKALTTGGVKIQLGAYRSEQEAKESWAKMQKKQDVLADMQPIIIKADLGAKGVYYRLRVGGFPDNSAAGTFCATLSAHGQPCIVATER